MGTVSKQILSGSTSGRGIKITQTATAGDTIHTAHATANDELWIYAINDDTSAITLTIEFGGTTDPDDLVVKTIDSVSTATGLVLVVPGLILSGSLVVKAFAGTADKITLFGYVNRITS